MGFGTKLKDGSLPVFKVGSVGEAQMLLTMACPTNLNHEYVARELVEDQTLKNLELFSTKLDTYHDILIKNGRCTCEAALKGKPNGNKAR